MYSSLAKRRVTTAVAGLLIAGSGVLVATPALAADPAAGASAAGAVSTASTGPAAPHATPTAPAAGSAGGSGAAAQPAKPTKPAAEPKGRVVSRLPLTVREYASSDSRALGTLQPGAVVALTCKVVGEKVDGNDRWYRLGAGKKGYVAARYVDNLSAVPWC